MFSYSFRGIFDFTWRGFSFIWRRLIWRDRGLLGCCSCHFCAFLGRNYFWLFVNLFFNLNSIDFSRFKAFLTMALSLWISIFCLTTWSVKFLCFFTLSFSFYNWVFKWLTLLRIKSTFSLICLSSSRLFKWGP